MTRTVPTLTTRPEALPPAIRELARVLGDADAMRLIGSMPGARVSVPKPGKAKENHPLRMALSPAGFDKLLQEFGGGELNIPKGDAYLRQLRHDHVRQCREQKLTFDETAEATGYSRRQCINIMGGNADDEDTQTRDMFEELESPASYAGWANDPFGLGKPD
ncbi:MAG: hypothetical protein V4451_05885 [Pseudomonadota bacterium]